MKPSGTCHFPELKLSCGTALPAQAQQSGMEVFAGRQRELGESCLAESPQQEGSVPPAGPAQCSSVHVFTGSSHFLVTQPVLPTLLSPPGEHTAGTGT